jgi:hypothetical protein
MCMRVAVVPIVDPSSKVRRISPEQLPSRKIAELGGTGRRRARFAAQSGPQRAYSNGRFLANPNIRWRSDEWLLRVELSRPIRHRERPESAAIASPKAATVNHRV